MATKTKAAPAPQARRGRARSLGSVNNASAVPENIRKLMLDTYTDNEAKKKLEKSHKKNRADLLGALQADGRSNAVVVVEVPNNTGALVPLSLTAEVETPERRVVDVAKLLKLVPMDDKLIALLGIGVEDVETTYGAAMLARCSTTVKGNANVNVAPTK